MDPDEEILRAHFDATNRGDYRHAASYYDEHAVLVVNGDGIQSGVFYGYRDVNRWFADWMNTFGGRVRFEDLQIERGRNALAATARQVAGSSGGVDIASQPAWAYWFREGKISRVELHSTLDAARAAAGVEP